MNKPSIDLNKASALEDRAHLGESQMDLLTEDAPGALIEAPEEKAPEVDAIKEFNEKTAAWPQKDLKRYLVTCANYFHKSVEEVKAEANKDLPSFQVLFEKWTSLQEQKKQVKAKGEPEPGPGAEAEKTTAEEMAPGPCPANPKVTYTKKFCDSDCAKREECPVWPIL